jgi:hypothetical protein
LIRHEYNKNKTFYDAQFSFVLKWKYCRGILYNIFLL